MKSILLSVFLSVCLLPLWGQRDFSQIDSIIKKMLPEASEVGISVYDLTAGTPLYNYRANKLSRPASTMKLLTAITALSRPEADNPFCTEVWYDGVIEHDTLQGNLYVVGGFDPEFDEQAMDSLIEEIITYPFSVINGRVYGDVSMKDSLYWGNGWAWDDNPEAYQPYLSPLMFCKGIVEVTAAPGAQQGDSAKVSCTPLSSYYKVLNEAKTRTPSAGKFSVSRDWFTNGNNVIIKGNVSAVGKQWINIYDSKCYFMHTFLERLQERGIIAPQSYDFTELPLGEVQQMACWETPVQDVLNQLMKESDNLNAEALLCRLGMQAAKKKYVAANDGIEEIRLLIQQLGYEPEDYKIVDGCGLSNYNYLSPALLVDFLKFAYSQTDVFRKLYKALPVAGIDGTLQNRMKGSVAYKNVHAKTGSFTAINALAGYLKMKNGHEVAFAIMNQNVLSAATARAFQDKVCEIIIGR
ncbi:D-alanyl-D-alanine carboxypeptidase/D-alanyl-D-alanine-endopeptidase [Bacteroides sp.]|uniref:D-alanyl-D-alanine carboxypeptidase/D-alanyl-D-alanine endopeptidase n=1 Tax=Bacteroides sp. TaxID=29523 RepID=UPI0026107D82|nr:D-alanyl-D-alanine carboxypeptidase/D-alanyl-D-alanine-endopeptidase [Bacteroides sp.]MDD3036479.1 D-alanyl-D-alanine carboxypeptidase/D-alanyl-D-alanine-endopeptidase [Bacteroides sp.]